MDSVDADRALLFTTGEARTISLLKTIASYIGLAVTAVGALVLIGWAYNIVTLKSIAPVFVSMKANAAACFILSGLALWLTPPNNSKTIVNRVRQYISSFFAATVITVGLLVLSEYIFAWDPGIDQIIFKEPAVAFGTVYPGRIVLTSALSFILAALALMPLNFKATDKYAVPQYLALAGILISLTAIIGYIYGLREFLGPVNLTPLPLITALTFILLFSGILLANPVHGPIAVFLGKRAGSVMLRITLPLVLLIVVVFGWLHLLSQRLGSYSPEFAAGVFSVVDISGIILSLVIIGIFLNRLDQRRWQAEEKLRLANIELSRNLEKTQSLLYNIIDNAPAHIVVATPDGRYHLANKAWEEFFGFTIGQSRGKTREELFSPKMAEQMREIDQQVITAMAPVYSEINIDSPRGPRYFSVVKFPLIDGSGKLEAIAGIATDITSNKQAEIKVRESEKLYRSTLANMMEGAQIISRDWRYLYLNDSAVKHARKSSEELIGRTMMEAYPGIDKTEMFTYLRRAMQNGESSRIETEFTYPDGSRGWFDLSIQPVPEGIFITSIDVTERKKAEEMLRQSEVYYRSLIENSTDIIIVLEADGTVRYVSPSVEELLGYRPEEMIGKDIGDYIHPEDLPAADKSLDLAFSAESSSVKIEARFRRKEGTWLIFAARGRLIPDSQAKSRLVINAHDITDYRQAQKELSESYEKVQEALRQTINLVASITEKRDPYTAGHQKRVTALACAIAREIGLTESQIEGLRMAGTVHDLGKINVPADILNKPGRLGDMEFAIVKLHPETAFDILKVVTFPWPVADIVNQHHEREDGSGYPLGLKGDYILPESKVLAVADVVEAMASHRPYRPSLGIDKALEEIKNNRGTLYNADAVDACLRLFEHGYNFEDL